jgi:hypothetical protein
VSGSFEHTLNEIVEEHLGLIFQRRDHNEETGQWAYDPKLLPEKLA